jgi:hypothetical protein
MDTQYEPPVQIATPPPPPVQLSPEQKRSQQLSMWVQQAWVVLQKIAAGLGKVIEDVAESILRR